MFEIKREVDEAFLDCTYGGLCVRSEPSSFESEYVFERCLGLYEEPVICTDYIEPSTDKEIAAGQACFELWMEMRPSNSLECGFPWSWPRNEDGFDASITITMGLGLEHWLND